MGIVKCKFCGLHIPKPGKNLIGGLCIFRQTPFGSSLPFNRKFPFYRPPRRTGDKSSLIGTRAIFLSEEQSKQRRQRQSKLFLRLTSAKTVRFIIPGGGDPHFLLIKSAEGRAKMELLWFAWKVENCALSPILNSL